MMFTNKNGCTIYEKTIKNRTPTYIRHEIGAIYWENSDVQKSSRNDWSDRRPENSALVIIPEKSADYLPKTDDKIVAEIIADEQPPPTAMAITKVRDFRYTSAKNGAYRSVRESSSTSLRTPKISTKITQEWASRA